MHFSQPFAPIAFCICLCSRLLSVPGVGTYVFISHQLQMLGEQKRYSNHLYPTTASSTMPGLGPMALVVCSHFQVIMLLPRPLSASQRESEDGWLPLVHGLQRFLQEGERAIVSVATDLPILPITGPLRTLHIHMDK